MSLTSSSQRPSPTDSPASPRRSTPYLDGRRPDRKAGASLSDRGGELLEPHWVATIESATD